MKLVKVLVLHGIGIFLVVINIGLTFVLVSAGMDLGFNLVSICLGLSWYGS